MKFSVYRNGKRAQESVLESLAKGSEAQIYEQGRTLVGGVTVVAGLDDDSLGRIIRCRKEGKPFVFLDHAYFDRGYKTGNFRVIVNGVHQTTLLDVPGDRWERFGITPKPWRQGREVVVIAPSERVCTVLGASKRWAQETAGQLGKYTSRPIRIKFKGPGLDGELKDAHCVVSLSSVAEVEAALIGVPVFASQHSPAAPIAEQDFSKIESPLYPDRGAWLRTLAYSQWHISEMADGTTTRHLRKVLEAKCASNSSG